MKNISHIIFYIPILLSVPFLVNANEIPKPMKDKYQNHYYQASCSVNELDKLKVKIHELSAGKKSSALWELVETILCNEGVEAEKYVMNHMPKKLENHAYNYESNKIVIKNIPSSTSVMLKKKSWAPYAQLVDKKIEVQYRPNQFCIQSFMFSINNGTWYLVGIGGYCD